MAEYSLLSVPEDIEERFNTAAKWVQSLPKDGHIQPSNERKLVFYGLYKRITVGENNTTAPSYFSMVARAKWEAWSRANELSRDRAMQVYLTELCRMIEETPDRPEDVNALLLKLKGSDRGEGQNREEGEGKEVFWDANLADVRENEDSFHHIKAPSISQVQSDSPPSSENHASDASSSSEPRNAQLRPQQHQLLHLQDLTQMIAVLSRIQTELTAIVNTLNSLKDSLIARTDNRTLISIFSLPSLVYSILVIWPFIVFYILKRWKY